MRARLTLATGVVSTATVSSGTTPVHNDPLPSWNPGAARNAITGFVARVTTDGSPDFVRPAERIAVFDNDGTLWCEQPTYIQLAFAIDQVKAMGVQHPQWADKEPFRSLLGGNGHGVAASGENGIAEIIAVTHAGMTTDEFNGTVKDWLRRARHPGTNRPYTECAYQPMLELLAYLRASDFKTFIVSGGGVEFIRAFAEQTYGIPPEQVVGSSGQVKLQMRDDTPVLVKQSKIEFVDDGPGKPMGINRFIGRRPIMAFGNSDGDLEMLQWTASGDGPRFCLYVHHTDAEREWAYDRTSRVGRLDKGLDEARAKGWTVVDMMTDWRTVFPPR